jgi:hypothetical protein
VTYTILEPTDFDINAQPNNMSYDSGDAIQDMYDAAFGDPNVVAIKQCGQYRSERPLSPTLAQTELGSFDMPFEMHFVQSSITFYGTGFGSQAAYKITHNVPQNGVHFGRIDGGLWVRRAPGSDYRDGAVLKGIVEWDIDTVRAGTRTYAGAATGFARNGIRLESNDNKGGVWNTIGTLWAVGGTVPVHIGPGANSNAIVRIFSADGSDGLSYTAGSRNSILSQSVETHFTNPRYFIQNAGVGNVVAGIICMEPQGTPPIGNPNWVAAIWNSGGSIDAKYIPAGFGSAKLLEKGAGTAGRLLRFDGSPNPYDIHDESWG